jgi:hypothetical protein
MADTRISKIKVRQGNFSDLPLLDAGEFGYALDNQRLFIGNSQINVGTGNGVKLSYVVPTTLVSNNVKGIFLDGTQVNTSDYSIVGTTLTFATPPGSGVVITALFNSEVDLVRYATVPNSISLAANGNLADTGFSVDTSVYNVVIMDYTLESTNGVRAGQLRFGVDTSASTTMFDDNYTQTSVVDIVFNVDISVANTMKLQYTDNDNAIATFKYTYQLWNSN